MVSIQLSSDGKSDDVVLWGMATEKGMEMIMPKGVWKEEKTKEV